MAKIKPFPEDHDLGEQPWQRQRGESQHQYTWFRRYMGMRLPRSIRTLADQQGVSADHLYAISSARRWAERAWAWEMAEQTQRDREVLLRQRRNHADLTEAVSHLTARCLAHARAQVDQLPPDKAVARAFDGARTMHQMTTSPHTPGVQVTNTVTTTAGAQAGEQERQDAAHGRDDGLEEALLAQMQHEARHTAAHEQLTTPPAPAEPAVPAQAAPAAGAGGRVNVLELLDADEDTENSRP